MSLATQKAVDLHLHGIDGFDTTFGDSTAIAAIAEREGKAGVSEILLSIYPGPVAEMRRQIEAVRDAMKHQDTFKEAQGFTPARILGVHLEGPFLNPSAAGALEPSFFIGAGETRFRELIEGFEGVIRTMTVAPEMQGAISLIARAVRAGIVISMGHSNATFQEAEAGFRAGAKGITHIFNAMRPFHHREVGLAGFGLLEEEVFVEVIGDLVHLNIETLQLVCRVKSADRLILVSDSVRHTRSDGRIVPRTKDGGLLGGAANILEAARRLEDGGINPDVIVRAMTENPQAYLALG